VHPELLSDEAEMLLEQRIADARALNAIDAMEGFEEYRDLLRHCREIGVESAFAREMGIAPELLSTLSTIGTIPSSLEDLSRLLAERSDLRERLEAALPQAGEIPDVFSHLQ